MVSTLTHTLPVSTGTSRSVPSSSAKSSAPAGSVTPESAKTPASSAREAKVLSTPNATSPVGLSLVSTNRLVSVPASPTDRTSRVRPESASNFLSSFLGSAKESWVTSTTSDGTAPEDGSGAVSSSPSPTSEHADRTSEGDRDRAGAGKRE